MAWDNEFSSFKSRGSFVAFIRKLPEEYRTEANSLMESVVFKGELVSYLQGDTSIADVATGAGATAAANATAINSILAVLRNLGPVDE